MTPPDRRNDVGRRPAAPANGVAFSPDELASFAQKSIAKLTVGPHDDDFYAEKQELNGGTRRIPKDYP
jgi:hypothetical protein